nr:DUF262 domain-containing protein [Kineosporia rhizophila]
MVGDISGKFFVPSYQRGYRWGRDEVLRLLEDIQQSAGKKYLLQPVVVKRRDDGTWELVDGQQRLTTLFLILCHIRQYLPHAELKYSLQFETRAASADYLRSPTAELRSSNIDFLHIYDASELVRQWFEKQDNPTMEAVQFYGYLTRSVSIIWYEAPPQEDSTALFTRLNVGRIPLTDAELVKALMLTKSRLIDREREVAAQWDAIEADLRRPEVWAFITRRPATEPTHIVLLLDTLAPWSGPDRRPLFHTFETLRPQIETPAEDVWTRVINLHSLIIGWYDNRDTFHKIGYLIARGDCFEDLVKLSEGRRKHEFENLLDARIRDDLQLTDSDVAGLRYGEKKTEAVLLLMNVETVRRMRHSTERFSFQQHARRQWSIEHIHARNTEQLNRAEQWSDWLRLHRDALAALSTIDQDERKDLTVRINSALENLTESKFRTLEPEVSQAFSQAGDDQDIDSIANLALLSTGDNSALNNSVFEVKRRSVLALDREGSYIPVCTRNAFLKYYTEAEGQQIHFWGAHDREGYLAALRQQIAGYLMPERAT